MFRTSVVAIAALSLLTASAAPAQTRASLVPALSVAHVYDDNLFADVQGSAGQMLQIRPSLEAHWLSPRLELSSLYSFDMLRSNHSDLNTFDARRHAFFTTEYRASPMTTLGLTARYDRTETPGELNFDTGILGDRRQAQRWQVAPTVVRRVGRRVVMTAGYDWSMENLVDSPSGTLHAARLGVAHEWTPRASLSGFYLVRHFTDPLDTQTSHAVLAGWDREMAPNTRLSVQAGPRLSSYTGLKPEISGTFTRLTNRIDMALNYTHGETIILGIPGPVAVNGATGRVTWPFTHRIELGTHFGVTDVTTIDEREARVYRTTLIGSWMPHSTYTVAASYGLDYQQGDIRLRLDDDVLRHVFRVSLTVAPRFNHSTLPPEEAARVKGVLR